MGIKEINMLNRVFRVRVEEVKRMRLETIGEMLEYIFFRNTTLKDSSPVLLTHLCRLADNAHCSKYGAFIVPRTRIGKWENNVLDEIGIKEVRTCLKSRLGCFYAWNTSKSNRDSIDDVLSMNDAFYSE